MNRFVILSQPRTGSSLLVSSLRSHRQIVCRDEVINRFQADWFKDFPLSGGDRLLRCLAPVQGKAVGCKMHAFQPDTRAGDPQEWESAWEVLRGTPEIRVILLYRKNVIAQFASHQMATSTGEWGMSTAGRRPEISINIETLDSYYLWNKKSYQKRLESIGASRIFRISYEDLTSDWEASIEQIQKFLEVDAMRIHQATKKVEVRNLKNVITNYRELVMSPQNFKKWTSFIPVTIGQESAQLSGEK